MTELIKQEEACNIMNISRWTYYRLCKMPTFPAVRIGRNIMVDKDALFSWISAQKNA